MGFHSIFFKNVLFSYNISHFEGGNSQTLLVSVASNCRPEKKVIFCLHLSYLLISDTTLSIFLLFFLETQPCVYVFNASLCLCVQCIPVFVCLMRVDSSFYCTTDMGQIATSENKDFGQVIVCLNIKHRSKELSAS